MTLSDIVSERARPRKAHSRLGRNFVAPDGGWGWVIVLASGLSNLATFPALQQFGLLFKQRMRDLDISAAQMTSIINTHSALSSIIGLANGPLFRRWSYRRVALGGATLVLLGVTLTAFARDYLQYLVTFAVLYGTGIGINAAANSLVLNTFFMAKRRYATAFSWTLTGIGPIVFPHLITHLLPSYGFVWTVLLFAGIAVNALTFALFYEPVKLSVLPAKPPLVTGALGRDTDDHDEEAHQLRPRVLGHDSAASSTSSPSPTPTTVAPPPTPADRCTGVTRGAPSHIAAGHHLWKLVSRSLHRKRSHTATPPPLHLSKEGVALVASNTDIVSSSWWNRTVAFFDLDLLRDPIYVNIMAGITVAHFAELNFSILTPFILADFGLGADQIATAMSLLGLMDISCRLLVAFVADRIGWQNRTFFLFGVLNMALGRILLAHFRSYPVILTVAAWIGFNKGLRTVFMALAIPTHVPLDRLPAAHGIHLMFAGLFYLVFGPLVGYVRDATDYATLLHVLNVATYAVAISWGVEMFYLTPRRERRSRTAPTNDQRTPDGDTLRGLAG